MAGTPLTLADTHIRELLLDARAMILSEGLGVRNSSGSTTPQWRQRGPRASSPGRRTCRPNAGAWGPPLCAAAAAFSWAARLLTPRLLDLEHAPCLVPAEVAVAADAAAGAAAAPMRELQRALRAQAGQCSRPLESNAACACHRASPQTSNEIVQHSPGDRRRARLPAARDQRAQREWAAAAPPHR